MSKNESAATIAADNQQPQPPDEFEPPRIKLKDVRLGKNVRDINFAPGFVEDIRRNGVQDPVDMYRDDDSELVLYRGFHRYYAALETGKDDMPYLVRPRPASNAQRIIEQHRENAMRGGFTTAETLSIYEQLALEGLDEQQIAEELSADRTHVKAALTITGTTRARAAVEQTGIAPTLMQAATLAEFDGDEDAIDKLVAAIDTGSFEHVAQGLRDDRTRQTVRQELLDQLTAAKVTVAPRGPGYGDSTMASVTDLKNRQGNKFTEKSHAKCPGHVAYLNDVWRPSDPSQAFTVGYACTDYKRHGHYLLKDTKLRPADMTATQRELSKAERADVIDSNRSWASAETVRRQWLKEFTGRKTAPKGAAAYIATAFALDGHHLKRSITEGNRLALELLGISKKPGYGNPASIDLAAAIASANDTRALQIGLVLTLAAYEERLNARAWRGGVPEAARYLRFLAANSYRLSDVEKRACAAEPTDSATTPGDGATASAPADADDTDTGEDESDDGLADGSATAEEDGQ